MNHFAAYLKLTEHCKLTLCCAVLCLVAQLCLSSFDPRDVAYQASLSMGIIQARIPEWFTMPSSRGPSQPALLVDSLLSEPPGKPKNTGVGSPSLLQGIFPTQELNPGLLLCRRILYLLSY